MTASPQSKATRGSRIIDRPRLMRLLDETDAKTILLIAPAGYGKTTLARQWVATLTQAVTLTLSSSHRDIAWLVGDLLAVIDDAGANSSSVREHLRARSNPQRAGLLLGRLVAELSNNAKVQWVVLDDYHEITSVPEVEGFLGEFEAQSNARFLIASRTRPAWASGRRYVYNELSEVGRAELAMTHDEAARAVGNRRGAVRLAERANGWPAIVALAAAANTDTVPETALPQALHRFLAEELFSRASLDLQDALFTLALLGADSERALQSRLGPQASSIATSITELGFSSNDSAFVLHPLVSEFLLEKLSADPTADGRVREAIRASLESEAWDRALDLVVRFEIADLVEPVFSSAFKPLVRSGRLETLSRFANAVASRPGFPVAPVGVVLAEVALRDGHLELARDLAERAADGLDDSHPLKSRSAAIVGQVGFLLSDFANAERWHDIARRLAQDDADETEALHGLAVASIFGESPRAPAALKAISKHRHRSPTDFLRFATSTMAFKRLGGDATNLLRGLHLDAAREAWSASEDPFARSSLAYTAAGTLCQRADYHDAEEWLERFFADAEAFGLDFAMPYGNWVRAQIALGLRRYGDAERALQAVEDFAARNGDRHHQFNAAALRSRLLVQNGEPETASRIVRVEPDVDLSPSWRGEYLASRGLAFACVGDAEGAQKASQLAFATSIAAEVRVLANVAQVISTGSDPQEVRDLLQRARRSGAWDPVVCGARAARPFAEALAEDDETRPDFERLCQKIHDTALARQTGLRVRATADPETVLSPREAEVLGLIARGYTNKQISDALFISASTTKVHVRHILEKLGVHTRAEAVARVSSIRHAQTAARTSESVRGSSTSSRNAGPRATR